MDKILQSQELGSVTITNDGATILKNIHIDNAAAKVLVNISKTQDDEVGDGTTSVVVLAGELLRQAEKLIAMRVHPMTIIEGWRKAADIARQALIDSAVDMSGDPEKMKAALIEVAETTLSSKILSGEKHKFSRLAVDAVMRLNGSTDLDLIQLIQKPGGTLADSYLEEGFLLDKKIGVGQPKRIENAVILIANTPMDTDKVKLYGSSVKVSSMTQVAEIEAAEKEKMAIKCQKIIDHGKYSKRRRSNVAVIIVRILFISSFLFYCLLSNHSFQTNPNKITNCFKLFSLYYNFTTTLLLRRYFDF